MSLLYLVLHPLDLPIDMIKLALSISQHTLKLLNRLISLNDRILQLTLLV